MSDVDNQYHQLLEKLLEAPIREDRTGTGTRGIFGYQMRFNLEEAFPLITTKRIFWRGVVEELLWMLSGSTNALDLPKTAQKWWTPWMRTDGELGPIYGEQYRKARWWYDVEPLIFDPPEVIQDPSKTAGVGTMSVEMTVRKQPETIVRLKAVWRDMLKRCYAPESSGWPSYGAIGIHVDPDWHHFDNFARDAVRLQGWSLKKEFHSDYSLDKDVRRASNRYSKDTCIWASHKEQSYNTSTSAPFSATSPEGVRVLFASVGEMARSQSMNLSAIHRCLNGLLKTHHGWSDFTYIAGEGHVPRFREMDQLKRLIAGLKHEPQSRRHMINLWHSPAMDEAALPCCHGSVIQFYVTHNGTLSAQVYQRSADVLLGLPVNIASYALLTHMIAHVTGLKVGELVWTGGDTHLYLNHIEQAKEQLSREPRAAPSLDMNPAILNIDDYRFEDIILVGYDPHPAIKAEVSV